VSNWLVFIGAYIVFHVGLDIATFSALSGRFPGGTSPVPLEFVIIVNVLVAAALAEGAVAVQRRLGEPPDR
jgi:hypothetical protein